MSCFIIIITHYRNNTSCINSDYIHFKTWVRVSLQLNKIMQLQTVTLSFQSNGKPAVGMPAKKPLYNSETM